MPFDSHSPCSLVSEWKVAPSDASTTPLRDDDTVPLVCETTDETELLTLLCSASSERHHSHMYLIIPNLMW